MATSFQIEDEAHAEALGRFESLDEALAELRRLAQIPWNEHPNQAPCTSWRTCGRRYEIVAYDASAHPWREVRRLPALEVNAAGVQWETIPA